MEHYTPQRHLPRTTARIVVRPSIHHHPPSLIPKTMTSEISKPAHCATCSQSIISSVWLIDPEGLPFHPAASLVETISELASANARATAELAKLHVELLERASPHSPIIPPTLPATAPGSGAGSLTIYHEIMAKNSQGRLGRTHMEDVDHLSESVRTELDNYLRRMIHRTVPVGGGYCSFDTDQVFATLATFGLRLEDRDPMADVTVFDDSKNHDTATIRRLQNFARHYYAVEMGKYERYWRALALETLIQLARYRGLFGADGFVIPAK